MILLIGGSSHVGKTLLAQRLLEKTLYPVLSLDHLKMGLIRSGLTELTVHDDLKMRYFLWPVAAEMVKTAIENGQNMIVEGCYIPGEWREPFPEEYLKHIRCVFIVMSERYIRGHMADIAGYANVIEHRIADETDEERLVRCSRNFRADAERFGIPCLEIDEEYNEKVLLERLCALLGLKGEICGF